MHFLKTKVDKTEWAVALFYEQFANSTDGIAFSMTLMHTEQDWKKLDIEKNPEKHIYKRQKSLAMKKQTNGGPGVSVIIPFDPVD